MRFSSFAVVAALAAVTVAAPTSIPNRHVLHEKRHASKQWVKRARVHSDVKLPVRIGLTQSNLDRGHDMLMDIADPESKNFAKHWTPEEVHEFFAPAKERVDAVWGWLEDAGVETHRISQSVNKQWLQLDLSTAEAENLFKTNYHFYEHAPSGKTTIGCDEYHVHEDVKEHVDYITPGIKLYATRTERTPRTEIEKRTFGVGAVSPQPPKLKALPDSLTNLLALPLLQLCDVAITPECIFTMYNISKATTAQPGNELGVFEDLGDYYAQEDLSLFFATLQPRIPITTGPKLEGVDGGQAPTNLLNAGAESDLDFQISYPIIWPQNSILFQTDDPVYEANYTYEGFLNNFLDAIDGSYCPNDPDLDPQYPHNVPGGYNKPLQCGVYKPTNVISISYGGQEADLSPSYQKRQCNEFMKLGMQGVSTIVASGDSGVAGPAGDDSANGCLNSTTSGAGYIFSPDFPASCPYLTAVGATLLTGSAAKDEEIAVTRFGSGGGFSNIYSIPDYQSAAVQTYLTTANPYKSYTGNYTTASAGARFNSGGRAYPDVSAVGDNIVIFNKGLPTLIGGTSASAPVFAAILTRINDERLKAGKKPVGFVNPTLYKNPQVLHDITVGSNPGCDTDGFPAAKGWDPVTGLGTPNFPAMLSLFMGLP